MNIGGRTMHLGYNYFNQGYPTKFSLNNRKSDMLSIILRQFINVIKLTLHKKKIDDILGWSWLE